jgi:hypothetical protein
MQSSGRYLHVHSLFPSIPPLRFHYHLNRNRNRLTWYEQFVVPYIMPSWLCRPCLHLPPFIHPSILQSTDCPHPDHHHRLAPNRELKYQHPARRLSLNEESILARLQARFVLCEHLSEQPKQDTTPPRVVEKKIMWYRSPVAGGFTLPSQ